MKRAILVNGKPTELIEYVPIQPSQNRTRIIVIPGNPGIVDFYKSYLADLYEKTEGKYHIHCVSHAGHTSMLGVEEKHENFQDVATYSLQEQISHKVDYLSMLEEKENTKLNFVLIGHSVGSYICLKLQNQKNFEIEKVINLFPTFQRLYDGLAPAIRVLIRPFIRNFASMIVHWCPSVVKRYFVDSYCSNLSQDAQEVVAHGINRYHVMHNILYMAMTETHDIKELEHELLDPLHKLHFLYGTQDRYTPLSQVDVLKEIFPDINIHLADDGIQHAFCTCPVQSSWVSSKTLQFIEPTSD